MTAYQDETDADTAHGRIGFSILDSKLFATPLATPGLDMAKFPGVVLFRQEFETEADFRLRATRMAADMGFKCLWVSGFINTSEGVTANARQRNTGTSETSDS